MAAASSSGTWLADRLKYSVQKSRILALSGISAVFGAFLATPLGGAFMSIEFTGLLGFPIYANLVAATVTGLVGYLIVFQVVGAPLAGLLRFEEVPVGSSTLGAAVLLGLLGVVMAFVFKFINAGTGRLVALLPQNSVLKTTLGGLGFGLIGALLPLTLFSGEHELPTVIETVVAQVDVDGATHLVKFSRYHDNQQFWTISGELDKRLLKHKKFLTITEPEPDEYELYDLTVDPLEQRNLAHASHATDATRQLQQTMFGILVDQLAAKRLVPSDGEVPGYRPPMIGEAVTK